MQRCLPSAGLGLLLGGPGGRGSAWHGAGAGTLLPREPRDAGGRGTAQWDPCDTDAAAQERSGVPTP